MGVSVALEREGLDGGDRVWSGEGMDVVKPRY